MAAWLLARSLRCCETLLGPRGSRLEQPHLLKGLSASAERKGAVVDDRQPIGPPSNDAVSSGESGASDAIARSGAWLPPHLLHKVLELAQRSRVSAYENSSAVSGLPLLGSVTGSSLSYAPSESCRGYGTLVEAGTGRAQQALHRLSVERLEASGVELVGSLAPESTPIEIKPKQVFAVVQVGPHQFKVTPDDVLYVEKLNGPDIKSTIILKKVLLLGSKTKTIVGRPYIPDALVTATVEGQVKDGKVLILKKRRRKNSRRLKGHRQELTRLRILDIMGIGEEQEEGRPMRVHNQAGVVARLKTPEPGKVSAYAFQPKPLPQSRDLKKQRRSPAVPGYGRRLRRHFTFGSERRSMESVAE